MTAPSLSLFTQRLLIGIVFLFIPIAIVAPQAVVWEVIIGGLIGLYYSRTQQLPSFPKPLTTILLVLPMWGLLTTFWANNPSASILMSLKILSLIILGIFWCRFTLSLSQPQQQSLIKALISGLVFGMVILALDKWSGSSWQVYWGKSSSKAFSQGTLMISLTAWPAILWILKQPYSRLFRNSLVLGLLISIFATLIQIDCDTSYIGLLIGICAFGGALLLKRLTSWGMRLMVPLLIVSFPFLGYSAFKPELIPFYNTYIHSPSYIDRLYIWNDVATTIFEKPWLGIGMDGTPHHENRQLKRNWTLTDEAGKKTEFETDRFGLHPHNAILQLWLELGIFGLLWGVLFAHFVLLQVFRTNAGRYEQAISAGLFTGAFLIVWVNLGFWQNWWISGLWMIIGLSITMYNDRRKDDGRILS